MTLTNILAEISYNDRDKESILDYLTRHFSISDSQKGALIGELRERKFSYVFRNCGSTSVVRYSNVMVANATSAKTVIN